MKNHFNWIKRTLFLSMCALGVHGLAQTTFLPNFVDSLNHPTTSQELYISKELPDGNFVFAGRLWDEDAEFIIRTDAFGNTMSRITIPTNQFDVYAKSSIGSIVDKGDSLIVVESCITKPDSIPAVLYYVMDRQLNIGRHGYWYMQTDSGGNYEPFGHLFSMIEKHPDGGYFALLPANNTKAEPNTPEGIRTYFRIDENLSVVRTRTLKTTEEKGSNIVYDANTKRYFSACIDGTSVLLDSSFNIIRSTPRSILPENSVNVLPSHNTLKKVNNSYMLTGTFYKFETVFPNKPIDSSEFAYSYIMVKRYDSAFGLIDSTCVRPIPGDSGVYPIDAGDDKYGFAYNGFGFRNPDSLLFGYFDATGYRLIKPGNYTLFQTDSLGKVRWAQKTRLDRTAAIRDLSATADGGIIVSGVLVNYEGGNRVNQDIYIAKHSYTGQRVWVKTIHVATDKITLYPNPATDRLHIQLPSDINIDEINIVDIMGRVVFTNRNTSNNIDIRLALETGIYFVETKRNNQTLSRTKLWINN